MASIPTDPSLKRDLSDYLECLGFEPTPLGGLPPASAPSATNSGRAASPISATHSPASTPSTIEDPLASLRLECHSCTLCPLHQERKQSVFGTGSLRPDILFVGEAPSAADEEASTDFAGPSGELLDKMILAMGHSRQSVYLSQTVKCRPPNNRNPEATEILACQAFLTAQIRFLKPKVIVALGSIAAQTLLNSKVALDRLRGQLTPLAFTDSSLPENLMVMPTFHPAFLLKAPESKKLAWEDLKKVMSLLKEGVS